MNREEFEQLREKKKKRLGFIKQSVWIVCYFCGVITSGYFLYGEKGIMPITDKPVFSKSVEIVPSSKQTKFGAVEVAAPTVTPTADLKVKTRDEPDSSVTVK